MAGRQRLGAEFARGLQQIAELDRLIALDARHRRLAGDIAVGETVDHRLLEAALVVEHVMRNADALGDRARVVDVLAGAAGALAVGRRAVIVKLQRDADDVVAARPSSAAVTEESTPPDMATTTRVSDGRPSISRSLDIAARISSLAPRRRRRTITAAGHS